jgi:hypothetical protein
MSFNAAALMLMAEKGLSAHDIAEIAAVNEQRSSGAARQARYRVRKASERNESDVTRDVTPSPNERDILTPTRDEKPSPKGEVKKADRGVRIAMDWEPKPLIGKAAQMVACWQSGQLERELAKFKNYWLSKGANAARTDWQRTWVNWLISADERKPRSDERPSNPTAIAVQRLTGISAHH